MRKILNPHHKDRASRGLMVTLDSKAILVPPVATWRSDPLLQPPNTQLSLLPVTQKNSKRQVKKESKEKDKTWGRNVSILALLISPKRCIRSPLVSAWHLVFLCVCHQELVKTAPALGSPLFHAFAVVSKQVHAG